MKSHIVINGNAFYEVDEECMERQKQENEKQTESGNKHRAIQKNGGKTDRKNPAH